MLENREAAAAFLEDFMNDSLIEGILSNSRDKGVFSKCKYRPVRLKGIFYIQESAYRGKQIFHSNLTPEEAKSRILALLEDTFRQGELQSRNWNGTILVSKKGKATIKRRAADNSGKPVMIQHDRKKSYLLEEGRAVPFLVDLGVMTAEGKVVASRYDKFRQINRFLEFVEDILPQLPRNREITIIDFGCGKSYLTFALYYYLHELRKYDLRIIGLDLKEEVIENCGSLARRYGFEKLRFIHGDIAEYEGVTKADMVVNLHACDTATDYALIKAIRWQAEVILSVPCCQHELHQVMKNEVLEPLFQYGLIQERTAALFTDAIRAQVLEYAGYRTQILEFIDMEHTPKNILIRAVKQGTGAGNKKELERVMEFLNGKNTLYDEIIGNEKAL
ncbi:SAM-dependent methyltransferase [Anaerolentibacter hominis]|uniref:class I SAM-dependent methyltransferase n=1 Tax=Anaerolentibacter hominis TaxID=3079009 RepID=UPI0031B84E46